MTERRNQARGANEWADTYGMIGAAAPMQLTQLPLHILDPWKDASGKAQPFKPYSPKRLAELADNIRENGIIEPICVRPRPNGRFQIIGGHNRVSASAMAGLTVVPALVRQLDDQQARDLMIYSNLKHRPFLLPSEKANAYYELWESLNHQGKRTDITSDHDGPKLETLRTDQEIAQQVGDSATNVKRYIRLRKLLPQLLDMVDNCAQEENDRDPEIPLLTFVAGYEISFLSEDHQEALLSVIKQTGKVPTPSQAKLLHKLSGQGLLDDAAILSILQPVKAPKAATVKLPAERIASFFPENTKPEDMEAEIYEALAFYRQHKTPASA
ncbi:MAG: ParB/RepB/Spo0J family partition protein [Oscillospiraceae bacterium]|nr:ParB/RepB/Spo0J family partition protein [Oscillospiraceae bacterium]